MTRKEFETLRKKIELEKLHSVDLNPLSFGMERAAFEKNKLQKLIALAETVEGKTVKAWLARWKRKLKRLSSTQAKFQTLRDELRDEKLKLDVLYPQRKSRDDEEFSVVIKSAPTLRRGKNFVPQGLEAKDFGQALRSEMQNSMKTKQKAA